MRMFSTVHKCVHVSIIVHMYVYACESGWTRGCVFVLVFPWSFRCNNMLKIFKICCKTDEENSPFALRFHLKVRKLIFQRCFILAYLRFHGDFLCLFSTKESLLFTYIYTLLLSSRTSGCDPGWYPMDSLCYAVFLDSAKNTWEESRQRCISHGGQLIKIGSSKIQAFVEQLMTRAVRGDNNSFVDVSRKQSDRRSRRFGRAWLGLIGNVTTREWRWTASDSPAVYTNWPGGYRAVPDATDEDDAWCALLGDVSRNWKLSSCNRWYNSFICQKPASELPSGFLQREFLWQKKSIGPTTGRFCKTNFATIFGKVLVRFRPVR